MKRELKRAVFATADGFYRAKNRKRPRVLLYTDSRGENLVNRMGKTSFGTYVNRLRSKYRLTYQLCPEPYTTIVDFLNFIDRQNLKNYDAIVMHCGIVDFSPRPLSGIAKLKKSKAATPRFQRLFETNEGYYREPFEIEYYSEPTINMYSPAFLGSEILPELLTIPNLLWINANHFVSGWDGNYMRGRPSNIDEVVSRFDTMMQRALPSVVDLKTWTSEDIQRYTIDNIHFTRLGFTHVFELIDRALEIVLREATFHPSGVSVETASSAS